MTTERKRLFHGLDPWRPEAVAQELVSHVLIVAFALYFGIGYLGLILVFMAQVVIGCVITAALYPERGMRRHFWDLVKIVALMAFLLVLVVVMYLAATGNGKTLDPRRDLGMDLGQVQWAVALAAVQLSVTFSLSRREKDPKFAWARAVLMQNAATLLALVAMAFASVMVVPFAVMALEWSGWTQAPDAAFIVCMALVRLALALLLTRMPEREAREIAGQPYLD